MITLADRLKELRKSNKLTQSELGKILGVGKTTISMYETGNSTPNDEIKLKISEYFNISVDYLLGKTNIKNHNNNEETIALHSDYDYKDLPDEARKEIENYIEYIKQKYKK
ncbi:helix-turn-helix transcriptional regulator [Clostridium sp.]|uniref:helix-turn-helix transcriptional regulator n=2 Tax=Clostridium sp. TaxID=1506 RepID=UPI0028FFEFFB|nr:helix-turn-helix transcriptional regulator [Clostridium sp.]MDU1031901.1 helix-turn-helix transcriptional regulator [Clostridium sp.]MDU2108482.1 helix-turn-helix transcriptional regulator [Clostridium sp.]MDU3354102.1 helix-turn-helix transcriptional regulator [Clostridium sp.]